VLVLRYAILCSVFSVFTLFLFNLGKHVNKYEKFRFPRYIWHNCDVVYNWFISLLPPIVLDNLFGTFESQSILRKIMFKFYVRAVRYFVFSLFYFFICYFLQVHKPSLGSSKVPHKIWTRSVQPFWRLLDTNKQTNTQTSRVYINIDCNILFVKLFPNKF